MNRIRQTIGDNVRGFCHQRGWSQEKLAAIAMLHPDYLGRLERGLENIGVENLTRIARALNIEPFVLMMEGAYRGG